MFKCVRSDYNPRYLAFEKFNLLFYGSYYTFICLWADFMLCSLVI